MIKFRIEGQDVSKKLATLIRQLKNPKEMMQEVSDIIVEDIKERIIKTKTDPEGNKWAPWAPSTQEARVKDGTAALGLLYRNGELARSITATMKGSKAFEIGSNLEYAKYLQEGTTRMPARPFIGISKRAQTGINQVIKQYLEK